MGKATDLVDIGLDLANLGWLIVGNRGIKKALDRQNLYAFSMASFAFVISVVNTGFIVYEIRKNAEGAKIYDLSRANGKSGNNRDGSGRNRITL